MTKIIRRAQKDMENNICSKVDTNPKIFWKYVKSRSKTGERIPDLETETGMATTDQEKSEALSSFFTSVFTDEPRGPLPDFTLPTGTEAPIIDPMEMNREDIRKKLTSLNPNKSSGPDGVHPRILKEVANEIADPLMKIFQRSIHESKLPRIWKSATVTAIHKKGSTSSPGNYRPISLTCIPCKILESLVRDSIMRHMKGKNLFSARQFGFINGRSTMLQLLHVMEKWSAELDEGNNITVAYLDFQKAFDTVPHRRLLLKLKTYGIQGNCLSWIEDFLSSRYQTVTINGEKSQPRDVTSGIPQGSVLGPTLFTIFINELPSIVESLVYLFADDTKIFRKMTVPSDSDDLQQDLNTLHEWTDTWLLRFHPGKCKIMNIGPKDISSTYTLPNSTTSLLETTNEKDLGVIIDSKLTFRQHMTEKVKTANKMLGIIRRSFSNLTPTNLKKLYTAMVRPHLEYCGPVWQPTLKRDIKLIEGVQRRSAT